MKKIFILFVAIFFWICNFICARTPTKNYISAHEWLDNVPEYKESLFMVSFKDTESYLLPFKGFKELEYPDLYNMDFKEHINCGQMTGNTVDMGLMSNDDNCIVMLHSPSFFVPMLHNTPQAVQKYMAGCIKCNGGSPQNHYIDSISIQEQKEIEKKYLIKKYTRGRKNKSTNADIIYVYKYPNGKNCVMGAGNCEKYFNPDIYHHPTNYTEFYNVILLKDKLVPVSFYLFANNKGKRKIGNYVSNICNSFVFKSATTNTKVKKLKL